MTVNRPCKGLSLIEVLDGGMCFPSRSADLLTLRTCCKLHPLMEALNPGFQFVSLQQCLTIQLYLLLSCANHSAAAAPSQTDGRSLVWFLNITSDKFNQSEEEKPVKEAFQRCFYGVVCGIQKTNSLESFTAKSYCLRLLWLAFYKSANLPVAVAVRKVFTW